MCASSVAANLEGATTPERSVSVSRPSYELVLSSIEREWRSSADVATTVGCSEWAAARALQQLRERGYAELVRDHEHRLVWRRARIDAVA